jgi:hypothetical protein
MPGGVVFQIFEPIRFDQNAPRWAKKVPKYPLIFGHSAFGHLFVCSEDRSQVAVVVTERPEFIELQSNSIDSFEATFLTNKAVLSDFFRIENHNLLAERLGKLSNFECYFPVPYPAVGGSGELDSYQKGSLWGHLDLYGQIIGL